MAAYAKASSLESKHVCKSR